MKRTVLAHCGMMLAGGLALSALGGCVGASPDNCAIQDGEEHPYIVRILTRNDALKACLSDSLATDFLVVVQASGGGTTTWTEAHRATSGQASGTVDVSSSCRWKVNSIEVKEDDGRSTTLDFASVRFDGGRLVIEDGTARVTQCGTSGCGSLCKDGFAIAGQSHVSGCEGGMKADDFFQLGKVASCMNLCSGHYTCGENSQLVCDADVAPPPFTYSDPSGQVLSIGASCTGNLDCGPGDVVCTPDGKAADCSSNQPLGTPENCERCNATCDSMAVGTVKTAQCVSPASGYGPGTCDVKECLGWRVVAKKCAEGCNVVASSLSGAVTSWAPVVSTRTGGGFIGFWGESGSLLGQKVNANGDKDGDPVTVRNGTVTFDSNAGRIVAVPEADGWLVTFLEGYGLRVSKLTGTGDVQWISPSLSPAGTGFAARRQSDVFVAFNDMNNSGNLYLSSLSPSDGKIKGSTEMFSKEGVTSTYQVGFAYASDPYGMVLYRDVNLEPGYWLLVYQDMNTNETRKFNISGSPWNDTTLPLQAAVGKKGVGVLLPVQNLSGQPQVQFSIVSLSGQPGPAHALDGVDAAGFDSLALASLGDGWVVADPSEKTLLVVDAAGTVSSVRPWLQMEGTVSFGPGSIAVDSASNFGIGWMVDSHPSLASMFGCTPSP